jgi:hypothetical protein
MDVELAFFYVLLEEVIYMKQPMGFFKNKKAMSM